jgi:alanyl-tRNA synthetase
MAQALSAGAEEVPALVLAQAERLAESDKQRRKLEVELAERRGRELHASAVENGRGIRVHIRRLEQGAVEEGLRAEAQGFCGCGKAVFAAAAEQTGAVLLAASADSGVNAGAILKRVVEARGGRGGGGSTLARGSVAREAVGEVVEELAEAVG